MHGSNVQNVFGYIVIILMLQNFFMRRRYESNYFKSLFVAPKRASAPQNVKNTGVQTLKTV